MSNQAAAEMKKHADAAVEMLTEEYGAQLRASGIQMDFSEQTVGIVESVLGAFHEDEELDPQTLKNMSLLFGAYVGEILRKQFPKAQWAEDQRGAKFIQVGTSQASPVAWCYKRLVNGESVFEKYMTFRNHILAGV